MVGRHIYNVTAYKRYYSATSQEYFHVLLKFFPHGKILVQDLTRECESIVQQHHSRAKHLRSTYKLTIFLPYSMEHNSALALAFALSHVRLDFAADLIDESKAKVLKDLESAPLLIDAHQFLEGAPPFVIASAGNVDLNLPFDLLYALKDDREQLLAMFFKRLRLHLESVVV